MPPGRPSKYDPAMCATVLKLMCEGASIVEVAAELGVNRSTVYEWQEVHEDFSDTIKRGTELSEAWWQRKGRVNLENKDFSAVLWYMNMKNRFGWADRQQMEHSGGVNYVPYALDPTEGEQRTAEDWEAENE